MFEIGDRVKVLSNPTILACKGYTWSQSVLDLIDQVLTIRSITQDKTTILFKETPYYLLTECVELVVPKRFICATNIQVFSIRFKKGSVCEFFRQTGSAHFEYILTVSKLRISLTKEELNFFLKKEDIIEF